MTGRAADLFHLFVNTENEDASPLTELASFKAYSKDVGERCEAPPEVTRFALTLLESYGLTSA